MGENGDFFLVTSFSSPLFFHPRLFVELRRKEGREDEQERQIMQMANQQDGIKRGNLRRSCIRIVFVSNFLAARTLFRRERSYCSCITTSLSLSSFFYRLLLSPLFLRCVQGHSSILFLLFLRCDDSLDNHGPFVT